MLTSVQDLCPFSSFSANFFRRFTQSVKLVFCGYNPSLRSGATGYHYAHPGNRFWRTLFEVGLTPHLYRPDDDHLLPDIGIGLTDPLGNDAKPELVDSFTWRPKT